MKWKLPPVIKIYEAIGAVADGRVTINDNEGRVYSSSGNKHYDVSYSPEDNTIMSNDNGSYWQGYLGYPSIAFLIQKRVLPYNESLGQLLEGVPWKDLNQKYKNDFPKTLSHIMEGIDDPEQKSLKAFVEDIEKQVSQMELGLLGIKKKPPIGY